MRLVGLVLALMAAQGAVWCASGAVTGEEYRARREKLRKALPEGITVLFGRTERDSDDLRSGFFQEPNFYYLTGWLEPGAILLIAPQENTSLPRETFFVPRRSPEQEKWTGITLGPDDASVRRATGCDTVQPAERFEAEFRRYLEHFARIYALSAADGMTRVKALAPLRAVVNAAPAIAKLRMVKSAEELTLLDKSIDASIAAHFEAWKIAAPGLFEYQVAAAMTGVYFGRGCQRNAYAPIVGSGANAVYLHYSRNARRMDRGELLLMDVGAECAGYAADITRTIPLGGRFSKRQSELYDVVLGAQKAAIAAVKPGVLMGKDSPNSLYKVAYEYINTHGKDLHGQPLGKYFTHGLGHHVGLEVHDASDPNAPLEEGMVITIEPGIYIPEENVGIRIEDMVLVTKDGARLLTGALPREAAAVEKAIAK